MSAFVVSHTHINALVSYAIEVKISYYNRKAETRIPISHDNAEAIGQILLDENMRSVCERYPDCGPDNAPGSADEGVDAYTFKRFRVPLTAVEAIKACHCLAYQSCETDDWEQSIAHSILDAIQSHATHHIPGYDAAPWGIDSEMGLKHAGSISLSSRAGRSKRA